jgi:YegS/Rv2252/BmrU family lipid kinase
LRVAVVINPISGTGGRRDAVRKRAELVAATLEARGVSGEIFVTERPGHARELTAAARARGTDLVIAWGGDGTMNEVASALAFSETPLAIIPSGSGNGLARELQIPFQAHAALAVALDGRNRSIDAGELDGHLFFNIAGVGLDAQVARRFAANGHRRGFTRYLDMTLREVLTYRPAEHAIATDVGSLREPILIVAIANGRQYGNGAIIAPEAILDDGRFDVVVVRHRSPIKTLLQIPRVFAGQVTRLPGVTVHSATTVEIAAAEPLVFHVDGESCLGGRVIRGRMHSKALTVRVPATD